MNSSTSGRPDCFRCGSTKIASPRSPGTGNLIRTSAVRRGQPASCRPRHISRTKLMSGILPKSRPQTVTTPAPAAPRPLPVRSRRCRRPQLALRSRQTWPSSRSSTTAGRPVSGGAIRPHGFAVGCGMPGIGRTPALAEALQPPARRIRACGERAIATLKTWKLLTKLRCCPRRAIAIVQAILVLHHVEDNRYAG